MVGVERSCGGDNPSTRSACLEAVAFTSGPFKSPVQWVQPSGIGHTLHPLVVLGYDVNSEFHCVHQSLHFLPAEPLSGLWASSAFVPGGYYQERRDLQIPPSDCSFPCLVIVFVYIFLFRELGEGL